MPPCWLRSRAEVEEKFYLSFYYSVIPDIFIHWNETLLIGVEDNIGHEISTRDKVKTILTEEFRWEMVHKQKYFWLRLNVLFLQYTS